MAVTYWGDVYRESCTAVQRANSWCAEQIGKVIVRPLRVKRWFAARQRFHVHFTPTYASWLNQVEIWFNRITQQAIRRGTFRSVQELVEKIDDYVQKFEPPGKAVHLDRHGRFRLR
jgi:hypothetical protein